MVLSAVHCVQGWRTPTIPEQMDIQTQEAADSEELTSASEQRWIIYWSTTAMVFMQIGCDIAGIEYLM